MIICGTPQVSFDLGIPDWAVVLILGLLVGAYLLGKREGLRQAQKTAEDEREGGEE